MAKRYMTTGMNLIDETCYEGSDEVTVRVGGTVIYGLSGMLFWSDDIVYTGRGGNDFKAVYGPYLESNGISADCVRILDEPTRRMVMRYTADGTSIRAGRPDPAVRAALEKKWRPDTEDIRDYIGTETEAVYISSPPIGYCDLFGGLLELKREAGFKIMWEPNPPCTFPEHRKATEKLCSEIEMASFNLMEGSRIFGTNTEEELIEVLRSLGPEMTLLRVGARGLYVITKDAVCFVPSVPLPEGMKVVDVTGCGNSSTAGAMIGWCETKDPAMTGIMANISSSHVLRQFGPCPLITENDRREAKGLADKLYSEHHYKYL